MQSSNAHMIHRPLGKLSIMILSPTALYCLPAFLTSSVYFLKSDSWFLHSYRGFPLLNIVQMSTPIENMSLDKEHDIVMAYSGAK